MEFTVVRRALKFSQIKLFNFIRKELTNKSPTLL